MPFTHTTRSSDCLVAGCDQTDHSHNDRVCVTLSFVLWIGEHLLLLLCRTQVNVPSPTINNSLSCTVKRLDLDLDCSFQSKYQWWSGLENQPESLKCLQASMQLSTYLHRVKPCVHVWKSCRHIRTPIFTWDQSLSNHVITPPTYNTSNLPASQNMFVQWLLLSHDQRQPQV